MKWDIDLVASARKSLKKASPDDRRRLLRALEEMQHDPFTGDIARLLAGRFDWRRRVGSWRIFFSVYPDVRRVDVGAIERRTSTTY